jgi:predicted TPR repeat methyltransferase
MVTDEGIRSQQERILVLSQRNRIQHFDNWAKDYDSSIKSTDHAFPFDGYKEVLDEIVRQAEMQRSMLVLDLGIGTGNLAERFIACSCNVWGIDFSSAMLAKTRAKLPQTRLVQADFFGSWPMRPIRCFDRLMSYMSMILHLRSPCSKD